MNRNLRFWLLVIAILLLGAQQGLAQVVGSATGPRVAPSPAVRIDPPCPVPPQRELNKPPVATFRVIYDTAAPAALLRSPSSLTLVIGFSQSRATAPSRIPFTHKSGTLWEAEVKPENYWDYGVFYVEDERGEIDNNKSSFWDVMLCQPIPTERAIVARSHSYSLPNDIPGIAREVDYKKAIEVLEREQDRALDHVGEIWWTKSLMYGNNEEGHKKLALDIEQYLAENWNNARALRRHTNDLSNLPGLSPELREKFMARAIELNPASANILRESVAFNLSIRERDTKKRIVLLDEFIEKYPHSRMIQNALSTKLQDECFSQKNLPAAERTFERWIKVDPKSSTAYLQMGRCYVFLGDKSDAPISVLSRMLELNQAPTDPALSTYVEFNNTQARYLRGQAYLAQGKNAAALADLEQAVKGSPSPQSDMQLYLARAQEANAKYTDAVETYLKLVINPCDQTMEAREAVERNYVDHQMGSREQLAKLIAVRKEERRKGLMAKYVPTVLDRPAPAFDFATLQGAHFDNEGQKGKVTVLNFWGIS